MKYLFSIILCGSILWSYSQEFVDRSVNIGLGNCGVALLHPESMGVNPANIAFINYHKTIYLQHSQPYFIRDLPASTLHLVSPFGAKYPFHVQLSNEGSSYFRHQQLHLAYGLKLDPSFSLGIQAGMTNVYMVEYGNYAGLNGKIGTLYRHQEQFVLAFTVGFPVGNHPVLHLNPKPQLVCGIAKEIDQISFTAELYNNSYSDKLHGRVGVVYTYSPLLRFRTGYDVGYDSFGVGMALYAKQQFLIDFSVQYHGKLGYTPSTAIGYVEYINDL